MFYIKEIKIKKSFLIIGIIMIISGLSYHLFSIITDKNKSDINLDFQLEEIDTKINETKKISYKEQLDNYRKDYNNNDIIAEVEIPNTSIKSIVTQSNDNKFYLDHNLRKETDPIGNIFMDYRVNINSRKILLYGHNSQTINTIFHGLENYINKDFYENNPNIILYTDEDTVTYKIFSVMIVTNDYQYFLIDFTDEKWLPHLNNLKSKSIYDTNVELKKEDEVLILQTCYYNPMNSYLVISAKKEN